jgi:hypothetical protein
MQWMFELPLAGDLNPICLPKRLRKIELHLQASPGPVMAERHALQAPQ